MKVLAGVGNYRGFDDSIGLRIVEHICENGLDRSFRAVEIAGNALNLFSYLNPDTESILIVDSAKMGLKPGDFRFFKPSEVSTRKEIAGFSTHEADLLKVLELARLTGTPIPPIAIMGIEPETVKPEIGLSRTLEGRLAEYAEAASGWDFFSSPPPR